MRRRDAERDDVGQRVDLQPERALRLGQARDAPVERVEEEREHEQQRGPVVVVVALRGGADADRVEPAEHARERDHVRQEEQRLAEVELADGVRQLRALWDLGGRDPPPERAGGKASGREGGEKLALDVGGPYPLPRPALSHVGWPANPMRHSTLALGLATSALAAACLPAVLAAPKSGSSTTCEPKSTGSRRAATGRTVPPWTPEAADSRAPSMAPPEAPLPPLSKPEPADEDAVTLGHARVGVHRGLRRHRGPHTSAQHPGAGLAARERATAGGARTGSSRARPTTALVDRAGQARSRGGRRLRRRDVARQREAIRQGARRAGGVPRPLARPPVRQQRDVLARRVLLRPRRLPARVRAVRRRDRAVPRGQQGARRAPQARHVAPEARRSR